MLVPIADESLPHARAVGRGFSPGISPDNVGRGFSPGMSPRAAAFTRRAIPAALALVLLTVASPVSAQRGSAAKPARIAGIVVADDTGQPMEGVSVRTVGSADPRSAMTDTQGRFEITTAPGAAMVTAVTAGYVIGIAGQRTPADPPLLIDLEPGAVRQVEIRLMPLGRIAGTVLDRNGSPAANVAVHVLSGRDLVACARCMVTTDAEGRYRLDGVRSGTYHVIAVAPVDPARGQAPGGAPATAVATSARTFARPLAGTLTYYPGTPWPEQAATVIVSPGSLTDATFSLADPVTARVAGRVVDSAGNPVRDSVAILDPRSPQPRSVLPNYVELRADGRFEFGEVPAGDYVLTVRNSSRFVSIAETGGTVGVPFTGELADVRIRVPSEGLEDLVVETAPGSNISGRVWADQGSTPVESGTVAALPGGEGGAHLAFTVLTRINPDGSFRIENVSGRHLLRVSLPRELALRRILAGGVDVTDDHVDVTQNLTLDVIAGPPTRVNGRVVTRTGRNVPGMTIVAFAEDPQRWNLRETRWVRSVNAAVDGFFTLEGLPAGRFYVAAIPATTEGRPAEITDLELLVPRATPLQLEDGEQRTVTVRID